MVYMYTVEPLTMQSPNSENLSYFYVPLHTVYTIHLNQENLRRMKNWLLQYFFYSEVPLYKHILAAEHYERVTVGQGQPLAQYAGHTYCIPQETGSLINTHNNCFTLL